jgi:hypothetical protein
MATPQCDTPLVAKVGDSLLLCTFENTFLKNLLLQKYLFAEIWQYLQR